jgi:Stage II sporulation protein E (SpoIIE)
MAYLLAIVSLAVLRPMQAQVFDLDKDRFKIVELDGLWRFHTGDDPLWADPNFDDSNWPLLHSNQPWTAQGYRGYSGMAWYRFKVLVPQDHKPLSIFVPELLTSYELFANGKLIATVGGMPPHPKDIRPKLHVHPIPASASGSGKSIEIAIRVWHTPRLAMYYGGGPSDAPFIGEADRVEDEKEYWQLYFLRTLTSGNILLLINLLAGMASMVLFWSRRTDTEYLWFGASEFAGAAYVIRSDYLSFNDVWSPLMNIIGDSLVLAILFCFLRFLMVLLKGRRDAMYWVATTVILARFVLTFPFAISWINVSIVWGGWALVHLPVDSYMLVILIRAARRGTPEARLLLAPVTLSLIANSLDATLSGIATLGMPGLTFTDFAWFRYRFDWPFPVTVLNVIDLFMQLSILAILLMRFVRTRRDQQRMATELESARAVQSVLIPSQIPEVPGFSIASVYKPATQVGGDLFQIIPNGKGGVLIVIGDVSGKGMPAAMTVSLLVGTIRTLAHYTQCPGEILSAMNARMRARSSGGFTTCLVLRADSDGALTVANAGHLAPYLDGAEVPLQNGLPLGLDAGSAYPECTFAFPLGAQLTLMTDGIVEARSKTGELYGFDRAAAIATDTADVIAQSAQIFGQEDDITVLTLKRVPFAESPARKVATGGLTVLPAS